MFDFSWSEIALIVVVALVFIGPKDMPIAIRTVTRGIKAIRRMASEFQGHVDDMLRDTDLSEAREQFRDLKRFDFRDRIARTIDSDQTISKSLDFTPPPSLSSPRSEFSSGMPVSGPGVTETSQAHTGQIHTGEAQETVKPAELPGPSIVPPATARRLRHEESLWHAPAMIPPLRVIHSGHRVALDPPPVLPPVASASSKTQTPPAQTPGTSPHDMPTPAAPSSESPQSKCATAP